MIKANITQRQPSDRGGILCLPLVSNLPIDAISSHPDWRMVRCKRCGRPCYESDDHRRLMAEDKSVVALCTLCALQATREVQHG